MKINIPIIQQTDVLVVGGTVRACNTALKLKKKGFSVFCVTPFSYFGEDICAYLELFAPKDSDYRELLGTGDMLVPMKIKHMLDRKFIDAGIGYLFQTHPVQIAYDEKNHLSGLAVANRSGFQLIESKVVVDATERSLVARLAGAPVRPFVPGSYPVELNMIGAVADSPELIVKELSEKITDNGKTYSVFKIAKEMMFSGNSPGDFARASTAMHRAVWHENTVAVADRCKFHLNDGLSGLPDLPVVPAAQADVGSVAELLKKCAPGKTCGFHAAVPERSCDIVRKDKFFRFAGRETVEFDLNSIPELDACDVFVAGGGTGGASAVIGAARAGAKTVCAETLPMLGGVSTAGLIGTYWFGNRVGFTREMDLGVYGMGKNPEYDLQGGQTNSQWKRAWLLNEADKAGAVLYFETMTIAAAVCGNRVCGAVVAGPCGVGVIRAEAVVDATGNADLAAAAGAETAPLVGDEPAVQGAGLPPVTLGESYTNSDYTFICDSDVIDGTRAFVMSRGKFSACFDGAQILDTRERRRIIGDVVLQPQDFFANRMYDDTVTLAMSNFDTHGFILHPMFMLKPTEHQPYYAKVPFRALLPRNLDGVLVTGLGVSAHRDCMPLIRMQPDVQNQGYAAGLACAMAAAGKIPLRKINIRALQKKLAEKEILPESILGEHDAIGEIAPEDSHYELASIFLDKDKALAGLRARFAENPDLHTAHILAFLGDGSGRSLLAGAIASRDWDQGWNYTGMGQFGASLSELDSLIMALSNVGGDANSILKKLETLTIGQEFSHIRAICMALMRHPDSRAVPALELLLSSPGAVGHAVKTLHDALNSNRKERNDTSVRNAQLKELYLAKALSACAPESGISERILKEYADGMQAYYALFARG